MDIAKFKVTIEVELVFDASQLDSPYNNPEIIAQKYADMAVNYGSIGANESKVVSVIRTK